MSDDIVTRLRQMWGDDDRCIWCKKHMDSQSSPHREVCDLMEAADEIERLQVERDMWKKTSTKLVGMMLPYSLLMNETERQELKIILEEATQ